VGVTARLAVGATVTVDDPRYRGLWTVARVNPTTYTLTPADGGRGLRAPHHMVKPAEAGAPGPEPQYRTTPTLLPGAIVQWARGIGTAVSPHDLWVVLADKHDKVNIAALGGDPTGRGYYFRALPDHLTEVPLDQLAEKLGGA
jgi:hypothetical protein